MNYILTGYSTLTPMCQTYLTLLNISTRIIQFSLFKKLVYYQILVDADISHNLLNHWAFSS